MSDSLDLLNDWLARKQKEENFSVPAKAAPIHITLQNPEKEFLPAFLEGLYVLECAMLEKGLDPSDFAIGKNAVTSEMQRAVRIILYDYAISFRKSTYSVRKENDMEFLAYFSTLCLSEDGIDDESDSEPHVQSKSLLQKLIGWLKADALTSSKPD